MAGTAAGGKGGGYGVREGLHEGARCDRASTPPHHRRLHGRQVHGGPMEGHHAGGGRHVGAVASRALGTGTPAETLDASTVDVAGGLPACGSGAGAGRNGQGGGRAGGASAGPVAGQPSHSVFVWARRGGADGAGASQGTTARPALPVGQHTRGGQGVARWHYTQGAEAGRPTRGGAADTRGLWALWGQADAVSGVAVVLVARHEEHCAGGPGRLHGMCPREGQFQCGFGGAAALAY